MRKVALDMVHQLAKRDPRVVFIGSDLGAGTLEGMRREFPERFYMEGVSEANIVGLAALATFTGLVYERTQEPLILIVGGLISVVGVLGMMTSKT